MSDDYRKKYASPEWRERRQEILNRDDFECQECGDDPDGLHVHHITPVSEGGSDDDENLRTLCPACHRNAHTGNNVTKIVEDGRVLKDPEHDWLDITGTTVAVANPDRMETKRTDGMGRLYLGKEFEDKHVLVAARVEDDVDDSED